MYKTKIKYSTCGAAKEKEKENYTKLSDVK